MTDPEIVPGWSEDSLHHELHAGCRYAFVPRPDTQVIERPGWLQIITPSLRNGGLNEVVHCDLSPEEIEPAIDQALADFKQAGVRFRWRVDPDVRPPDLAARLERRGLKFEWAYGVVRSTTDHELGADLHAVEPVDRSNVDAFATAIAEGWGTMRDIPYHRRLLDHAQVHMFLARHDGRVAGAASYHAFERSAHFLGAVVMPAFRRHRLYRALLQARLADAHEGGLSLATAHAREATSFPILLRRGFTALDRFPMFFGP